MAMLPPSPPNSPLYWCLFRTTSWQKRPLKKKTEAKENLPFFQEILDITALRTRKKSARLLLLQRLPASRLVSVTNLIKRSRPRDEMDNSLLWRSSKGHQGLNHVVFFDSDNTLVPNRDIWKGETKSTPDTDQSNWDEYGSRTECDKCVFLHSGRLPSCNVMP